MTLSFSNLTSDGSGSNLSTYNTASISPTAGAVLLIAVETDIGVAPASKPTISGLGATWIEIADCHFDPSGTGYRLTCFYGVGASGTGAITIDYGGVVQGGCSWSIDQVTGADTANPIVQSAKSAEPGSSATSVTVTLAGAIGAGNGVWAAAAWEAQEVGSVESGWTGLGNGNHAGPSGSVFTMARADNADNSGTISWTTSINNGGIIAEIRALADVPSVGGPVLGDLPNVVYFGETVADGNVPVATGSRIIFHNGDYLIFHDGSFVNFHDPVTPDAASVRHIPRNVYSGEAEL